jgi:UPF0176 protein
MTISTNQSTPSTRAEMMNISAYKFVGLERLDELKSSLKKKADSLELKGTILLSPEGINLFLSGHGDRISAFFDFLRSDHRFADIQPKESFSDQRPFRRMLVRLKKEIIAFGVPTVHPERETSPKITSQQLKQWLDDGRPVRLLDVRNDYEIELGTFDGADDLGIHHFRQFPEAIKRLPKEAKEDTIVMFCTGGIRCEKAGPLMEHAGFKHVYQLDGGILKYFEEVGGDHWNGSCFVFDGRVALDPQLQPTGDQLCFACQAVLRPEDLQSPLYRLGEFCPYCYQTPQAIAAKRLSQRQRRIEEVAHHQAGCHPYDNSRDIHVARRFAGLSVIDFLTGYQPMIPAEQWQQWIQAGHISFNGRPVTADQIIKEGQRLVQHLPGTVEPSINPQIQLLHEDDCLVVVNKPAPLPTHPSGRYNRNTLTWILSEAFPHHVIRAAHRLDANTSGVVVLCLKSSASRVVQPQFASGQARKIYLARVNGHPQWNETTCRAAIDDKPGEGGARKIVQDSEGLPCVTHFRILQRLEDGTSLVEVRPETGRTHQIRAHLWHLGHPVVHDPLYLAGHILGSNRTLQVDQPQMCLHAQSLTIQHPVGGQRVTYQAASPDWAQPQATLDLQQSRYTGH